MLRVIDRHQALIDTLYGVNANRHRQEAMRPAAIRGQEVMLYRMRELAPKGQYEPSWPTPQGSVNHGRPSIRQHGMTLDSGWTQEMETTTHGASFTIYNRAPHAQWVIQGTPRHTMVSRLFAWWWGSPLQSQHPSGVGWHPLRGDPPGPYHATQIDHPGAAANLFVQRSAMQNRPIMTELLRESQRRLIEPIRAFFEGRSVPLLK